MMMILKTLNKKKNDVADDITKSQDLYLFNQPNLFTTDGA